MTLFTRLFLTSMAIATMPICGADVHAESFDWKYVDHSGKVVTSGWLYAESLTTIPSNLAGNGETGMLEVVEGGIFSTSPLGAGMTLEAVGPVPTIPAPNVFIVDNVLYNANTMSPGQNLDYYEILFSETDKSGNVIAQLNIWGNNPTNSNDPSTGPGNDTLFVWEPGKVFAVMDTGGTFILTAVPEPTSFVLLGLGGIGLAFRSFRRRFLSV